MSDIVVSDDEGHKECRGGGCQRCTYLADTTIASKTLICYPRQGTAVHEQDVIENEPSAQLAVMRRLPT